MLKIVSNMIEPVPVSEAVVALTSTKLIKITSMAMIGAIVHALIAYRKGETRNVLDVIILTMISAFGGLIGGLLSVQFYPTDEIMLMIGAGMGGYLGVEGLTYLVNVIKEKFQK